MVVATEQAESSELVFNTEGDLCAAIADSWRPRPRQSYLDWVPANVRLPGDFGTPGRYDIEDFPYWKEPLLAADDPEVERIVLQIATQVGKTTFLLALMQAQSDIDPAPMMLVGPDRDFVAELRDKVYSACGLNPVLTSRIPPRHQWNLRWIDFGRCYCYLAWAGNTQRVSGKAVKWMFCSEVDRYDQPADEGAIYKLISERVKSFIRSRIVYESTPTDQDSAIAALYDQTDRRTYRVPCPHCGHYQELRFFVHREGPYRGHGGIGGMQDEAGNWLSADECRKSAYYICEKGCRIENEEKPGMVAKGVWCPAGCQVDIKGRVTGKPIRSGRVRGYQMGSLVARVISFGRIAAEYIESRENETALRNFFNNWLGLRYTVKTNVPKWRTLGKRLESAYRRGSAPAATLFLTAGCDVQGDRVYWVVRAWGEGCKSWLVDWGLCHQRIQEDGAIVPNSDLAQLPEGVIQRRFPLTEPNAIGAASLPVRLTGIDVNFQPRRVWDFVRKFPGEQVRAVAGDHQMNAEFFRMTVVEKNARDGKSYPGGLQRWGLAVGTYKADIQARWRYPAGTDGSWLLPDKIVEVGETYLRQLVNEAEITVTNKVGRPVRKWDPIDRGVGNHYWDCEVYARAMADMITGGIWDDLAARMTPATGSRRRAAYDQDEFSAR